MKAILIVACLAGSVLLGASKAHAQEWRDSTGVARSRLALDSLLTEHRAWYADTALRRQTPPVKFRHADLTGANLAGLDLRGVDLTGARLEGVVLDSADLSNAILDAALLRNASLRGVTLNYASVSGADLRGADLRGSSMILTGTIGTELEGARLEGVDLSRVAHPSVIRRYEPLYYDEQTKFPAVADVPPNLNRMRARLNQRVDRAFETFFRDWLFIVTVLLVLGAVGAAIAGSVAERRNVAQQKKKVEGLETAVTIESRLEEYAQAELNVAIERERLSMLVADSRSARLFTGATVFLLMSVAAPLVGLGVYLSDDPLQRLGEAADIGIAVGPLTQVPMRDWRPLVSGVSFGFLFIAAAAGLLAQARHHTSKYFRLGQRVNHYEGLVSALRIAARMDGEASATQAVQMIVGQLLTPASTGSVGDEEFDGQSPVAHSINLRLPKPE